MEKLYPKSKVETQGFMARHYDALLNIATFGSYPSFMKKCLGLIEINPADKILDLGAGTGRNAYMMMKYLCPQGQLVGVDISDDMIHQFKRKCANFPNVRIIKARIDQPLSLNEKFDKVFISFVLHGFPQSIREIVIRNSFEALEDGGAFFILDYNEGSLREKPLYARVLFKVIECQYAFDFMEKDWKKILSNKGFNHFEEYFFFAKHVRLLKATKI